MLNSLHLPSFDFLGGGHALLAIVTAAAAAVVVLVVLGGFAFRHAGQGGLGGPLLGGTLVLFGALIAAVLSWSGDGAVLRRSIDARAAELTARAIAPGSALACLDAVANAEVEAACEKALFATPESVATAVAYVDARISLLAASAPWAARDPSYQPSFERARRALEADRFGLVAHVLRTRGCEAADCPDLKLLQNSGHILSNMKAQTFDGYVTAHASAWPSNGGAAMANAAPPPVGGAMPPLATVSAAVPGKLDFPSAASIPAVSIMNAEPPGPASAEPQPEPRANTPPKRPQGQPQRRQTSREAPAREAPSSRAPTSVLPPPPPPLQTAPPQASGQR